MGVGCKTAIRKLVQIFKTMLLRGRGNIRRWIDFVVRSNYKLAGLKTFARGLETRYSSTSEYIILFKHPQSKGSVERLNCGIKDMLIAWMGDNDSVNWPTIKQSPYSAVLVLDSDQLTFPQKFWSVW